MHDVKIVEVGPRDGLQNENLIVSTENKLALIQKLMAAGLRTIEATSFVSAKWIPQMGDHAQLFYQLPHDSQYHFPVLVPNLSGLHNALSVGVNEIAVFAAASNTFSLKNTNRNIEKSLSDYQEVITLARSHQLKVRGYVSCVLGCPFEGNVPLSQVAMVAKTLYQAGCHEISLGDTIGVGTPQKAREMIQAVAKEIPIQHLAVHFHDTYGQALANIYACLEEGCRIIDSSVAGLGGCPYAQGASGNVATEDVVYMLNGLGYSTGVDLTKLIEAGQFICNLLGHPPQSKVAIAWQARNNNHGWI